MGTSPSAIEQRLAEPAEGTRFYFLKTIPNLAHKDEPPTAYYTTAYTNRFLRYTGSGHADTIVSEGQPVYLRFYLSPEGEQLAISRSHPGRVWGVTIGDGGEVSEEGVQLLMFGERATKGFGFVNRGDGVEVLMWRDPGTGEGEAAGGKEDGWKGWLLRDTPPEKFKGNPRVFADFEVEEGAGCARVDLIRHYVED